MDAQSNHWSPKLNSSLLSLGDLDTISVEGEREQRYHFRRSRAPYQSRVIINLPSRRRHVRLVTRASFLSSLRKCGRENADSSLPFPAPRLLRPGHRAEDFPIISIAPRGIESWNSELRELSSLAVLQFGMKSTSLFCYDDGEVSAAYFKSARMFR